jgi:hypothetical protein
LHIMPDDNKKNFLGGAAARLFQINAEAMAP